MRVFVPRESDLRASPVVAFRRQQDYELATEVVLRPERRRFGRFLDVFDRNSRREAGCLIGLPGALSGTQSGIESRANRNEDRPQRVRSATAVDPRIGAGASLSLPEHHELDQGC